MFDAKENSSLLNSFSSDKEVVTYQLNIGSGKYKKTDFLELYSCQPSSNGCF